MVLFFLVVVYAIRYPNVSRCSSVRGCEDGLLTSVLVVDEWT